MGTWDKVMGAIPFVGPIVNGSKAITHAGMAGIDHLVGDTENSVEVLGRSFATIIGDALGASDLDPQTVLELNCALSIGAFEVEGQRLLLRAMLPLAGLDDVDLRRVILHVCRQVAHVQRKVRAPARPINRAAFLHYAD
jgi:hypothetical protein